MDEPPCARLTQSMRVTAWNLAIAGGGIIGDVLLDRLGVGAFSPALLVLLTRVWTRGQHAFPAVRR
ncbi:hypothetical protein [Serratia odorifera]|uniref:hypothetical protein n=1 Tax=Serratia odorifera TaxID=618 RepID=UPI003B5BE693